MSLLTEVETRHNPCTNSLASGSCCSLVSDGTASHGTWPKSHAIARVAYK